MRCSPLDTGEPGHAPPDARGIRTAPLIPELAVRPARRPPHCHPPLRGGGQSASATRAAPAQAASAVLEDTTVFVPLGGLIDVGAERERLGRELQNQKKGLSVVMRKLANEQFLSNAPAEIVEKERGKHEELSRVCRRLEELLESLAR